MYVRVHDTPSSTSTRAGLRIAVSSYKHLSWFPISVDVGALAPRLIHSTAPILLTKNGLVDTLIEKVAALLNIFKQAGDLEHLNFFLFVLNKWRRNLYILIDILHFSLFCQVFFYY